MFELTDAAGEQLYKSLERTRMPHHEGKCFRVIQKDNKDLTFQFARPAPSDSILEHAGAVVLAVPKALRPFFRDKGIDVDQSGNLKLI